MEKETRIVEIEVLTPLFIKGKQADYGDGFITIGQETFLIDNDMLCAFIYDNTYDEYGNLREEGFDYVEWYELYMSNENVKNNYISFAEKFDLSLRRDNNEQIIVPKWYKNKSIEYFLFETELLQRNDRDIIVKKLAKGVTRLSNNNSKEFIQNGIGECFIPGSSIKGVIRNAVLFDYLKTTEVHDKFTAFTNYNLTQGEAIQDINDRRKYVEHFSEKKDNKGNTLNSISFTSRMPNFVGNRDNHCEYVSEYDKRWGKANDVLRDLFRIVKVSDANFINVVSSEKSIVNAYSLRKNQGVNVFEIRNQSRASLQTVKEKNTARFKITIDKNLAKEFYHGVLPDYLTSIDKLLDVVNNFFKDLVVEEEKFYSLAPNPGMVSSVKKWYEKLKISLYSEESNDMLLFRVGWGGGMLSKTQFLHLQPSDRRRVRNLTNDRQTAVAPKSRCLVADGSNNAVLPLGWCRLRIVGTRTEEYFGISGHKVLSSICKAFRGS